MASKETVKPDLYLASKSPRRRALLEQIGVRHSYVYPEIQEKRHIHELPEDYVQRLSREKALAGRELLLENVVDESQMVPVLGSDTIVVINGDVLEKPLSEQEALSMLRRLSASTHSVLTAVTVLATRGYETVFSHTRVTFRPISEHEAQAYWCTGEPLGKAGAYAIQGMGAVFVESIQGSYSGVVGLPLKETADLLSLFDVPVWQTQ